MSMNARVQQIRVGEKVEFINMCGCFVGKEDMYMWNGLHLSGNVAAVFVL